MERRMKRMTCKTDSVKIYLGLREGYEGPDHHLDEVTEFLQGLAEEDPICFSVTITRYVHPKGIEGGVTVGMINYPRFPKPRAQFRARVFDVAERLKNHFNQFGVTIEFANESITLSTHPEG